MPLSSSPFEQVLRRIRARREEHLAEAEERLADIKEQIPAYQALEQEGLRLHLEAARLRVADETADLSAIDARLAEIAAEKEALLAANGYAKDAVWPAFDCPLCEDRGIVDGTACDCLRREIVHELYERSALAQLLAKENFDHFDFDFYSDTIKNERTGQTAKETAKDAVAQAKRFIENVGQSDNHLLIYGNTGVGKSFLTHCIAKELLDRSMTVLVFSAQELFDLLADAAVARSQSAAALAETLRYCDCLIIDDLGTELTNAFVASKLFQIINERILHARATVISTNLTLSEFQERYTERVFSRISGHYQVIKLIGDDIRLAKHRR